MAGFIFSQAQKKTSREIRMAYTEAKKTEEFNCRVTRRVCEKIAQNQAQPIQK
jgi:hypothetical protein